MIITEGNLILGLESVFVGYAPTQKGYKCYDLVFKKKMFITMDVTIFENKSFFE